MIDYDVVVVGAGPAGTRAARLAAEGGAKTILIEEHNEIGKPDHCDGRIVGTRSGFLKRLLDTMAKRVVVSEIRARRLYSPKGRMVEISLEGANVVVVERNLLDLELARQAAEAGSDILVNTRVTGLIEENGVIVGVKTTSKTHPELRCKIVIAADGIFSPVKGIAKWAGLAPSDFVMFSHLSMILAGVKDVEPDIIETHWGQWGDLAGKHRNWLFVVPRGSGMVLTHGTTLEDWERMKAANYPLSKRIRDAKILRMWGVTFPRDTGDVFPKQVKGGLILIGNASNWQGNDGAIITGGIAGEVAAEAVKEGDFSEKKLRKYDELSRQKINYPRGRYMKIFFNRSDEEIEKMWNEEIVQKGVFACNDILPL